MKTCVAFLLLSVVLAVFSDNYWSVVAGFNVGLWLALTGIELSERC